MSIRKYLLVAVSLACLFAQSASASMHDEYTPDRVAELKPDEGYVLVSVETNAPLATIELAMGKGSTRAHLFENFEGGRAARLLKLPEGEYHWSGMTAGEYEWDFEKRTDLSFTVQRGVINYPGSLLVHETRGLRMTMRQEDESTLAIAAMAENFPKQFERFEFRFGGRDPDPYPEFYKRMKAKYANAHETADAPDSTAQRFAMDVGLPAKELFRGSEFSLLRIDPDGGAIAFVLSHGDKQAVYLFDVATADMVKLKDSEGATDITWVGRRTLALDNSDDVVRVYQLPESIAAAASANEVKLPGPGYVMRALPGKDGAFLFATHHISDGISVFQVNGKADHVDWNSLRASGDLATSIDKDYYWVADPQGVLRLGMAEVGKQTAIYFRGKGDSTPHEVMRLDADDEFTPVGLSDDGVHFYALTNRDRSQTDLVLVDGRDGRIGDTVYSRPGTDLVGVDYAGDSLQPIGARYAENGQIRTVYFAGGNLPLQQRLDASFDGLTVFIIDISSDGKLALIGTEGPTNPLQYYLFHVAENRAEPLSEPTAGKPLVYARSTVLKSKSKDGLEIESYLAMPPRASASTPLLVIPHGGPIGVRDYNLFDAETQFFASRGFAVLRVNYRGSQGFGKSFESAGEGQWGSAIEDDIQSAVDKALQQPGIDSKRIAILGTSYGGYSALMSVIRFPDEYRAAVAISAPSDLPLMFSSSDWSYNDRLRDRMKKIVGDPSTQMDKLESISPVYQFERIRRPVMFVHGDADRRATIEHSYRMETLLGLKGIDAESIQLYGGGHGITSVDDAVLAYDKIADFLAKNLN
jgi:dipeptidyl aminopeptidase/acylaminoacyl peptidase